MCLPGVLAGMRLQLDCHSAHTRRPMIHATPAGHVGLVTAVRWGQSSSGKSHLASCGDDGSVRVWDAEAGACVHVFDEHASVRRLAELLSFCMGTGGWGCCAWHCGSTHAVHVLCGRRMGAAHGIRAQHGQPCCYLSIVLALTSSLPFCIFTGCDAHCMEPGCHVPSQRRRQRPAACVEPAQWRRGAQHAGVWGLVWHCV